MVEYSHEKVSKMLSVTYELLNQQNRLGDGMSRFPNDFTREKIATEILSVYLPAYEQEVPRNLQKIDTDKLRRICTDAIKQVRGYI